MITIIDRRFMCIQPFNIIFTSGRQCVLLPQQVELSMEEECDNSAVGSIQWDDLFLGCVPRDCTILMMECGQVLIDSEDSPH